MKTKILLACLLGSACLSLVNATAEQETKYLAFQIFTTYSTDPKDAQALNNGMREPLTPGTAALRDYVSDIKRRIGIGGDRQTRLAVMLGPLTFDQTDAEITEFIERAFDLAVETDMAVGFHIDDCILWSGRKDLWSDPQNVETLDWDGTPCTGRQLNYSKTPMEVAPQMCFNSKAVQHEVRQRATLIGKAVAAGVRKLEQLKRPELFVGVISGWETQMGSDLKTGKYLGYRALLNRGFSREHPPQNQSLELEKVTQEFIELWTAGLAEAGAPPQKIYSHIAFLSRRAFGMGDSKEVTYMRPDKDTAYSQHNHFTPPSVAFGKNHRPGFSTYPQPGLFDDIYEQMDKHKQVGWASCEGTNMQPGTGPGQTGMNMETYLAKMFNHGATLITIFSWGIGGEAHKNMSYRLCTEGEEELKAYRKFLRGEPLIEGVTVAGLQERLPLKVHKIQAEFPAWMQKADPDAKAKAAALMQKLQAQAKGRDPQALEQTADAILTLMGMSAQPSAQSSENKPQLSSPPSGDTQKRLTEKVQRVMQGAHKWMASGRDTADIRKTMEEKFKPLIEAGKVVEAEAELDRVLELLNRDGQSAATPTDSAEAVHQRVAAKVERVKAGANQWMVSGRDLSAIAKMMEEKVKPLLDAGKFIEADAELDRVLEQLKQDGKSAATSTDSAEAVHQRVAAKIERVKQGAHQWAASGRDPSPIASMMEEKVGPLIKAGKFSEAEPEVNRVLEQLNQDAKSTHSPVSPTAPTQAARDITEELRDKLAHNLGCSFLVFRTKVLGELRVTPEQKAKLDQYLSTLLPEALQILQKNNGGRGKYNQKIHEERAALLKDILNDAQRTRLHQLELQKDLLFGPAWNMKELQITEEQQKQFMVPVQEKQKQTQALMAEIHKGANPDEIRPKALQLRLDLEVQLETLLTDAQRKQWKEMRGQPVDLGVIYGGVSSR